MANKQHAQFSDENGNLFYLESETEDVLDPSGKPLSNGGDLSEASVKFTADTTRKLPQSGGRFKAFLGSIVKYLSDLGAAAYLAVANNDTTTQAGFVGDARVLKQHRDAINQLSSDLPIASNYPIIKSGDISLPYTATEPCRVLITGTGSSSNYQIYSVLINGLYVITRQFYSIENMSYRDSFYLKIGDTLSIHGDANITAQVFIKG